MSERRRATVSRLQPHPLSFGGWQNYQDWADHDFLPRPVDAAPGGDPDGGDTESGDARTPDSGGAESVRAMEITPGTTAEPPAEEADGDAGQLTRPYIRTAGRTHADYDLRVETLVSATAFSDAGRVAHEVSRDLRLIRALCRSPRSVAEIAAHLSIPITTAQVLISDALRQGLLVVHDTDAKGQDAPSVTTMRRVHDGLLRLR